MDKEGFSLFDYLGSKELEFHRAGTSSGRRRNLTNLRTGEVHQVFGEHILIGSSEDCDLVLREEGAEHMISRKHAELFLKNDHTYLKDISSNGTYLLSNVDGKVQAERLARDVLTELEDDQIVSFAKSVFRISRA